MKRSKTDIVFKDFWRDNDRFASLFNAVIFDGRDVICPDNLQDADTEVSAVIGTGARRESLARYRDVVKKSAYGSEFVSLGIESQKMAHYAMPLRIMLYDGLGYLKECRYIARRNRDSGGKISAAEFLSGLKKSDRLHPVISIVIYYGEDPWDGPLTLKDMIMDVPKTIRQAVSDYRMNLVQVTESGSYHFRNEDVQIVFEISEYIFKGRFKEIKCKYGSRDIKAELAVMIGAITESEYIVAEAAEAKGGVMNMCTALEALERRGLEQGLEQGMKQGVEQGIRQGIEQSIRNLMASTGMTPEAAMNVLMIAESERDMYMDRIKQ